MYQTVGHASSLPAEPAPDGGGDDAGTRAGSPRHRERLQPGLTQRDLWVMHSSGGGGVGGRVCIPWECAPPARSPPTPARHALGARLRRARHLNQLVKAEVILYR